MKYSDNVGNHCPLTRRFKTPGIFLRSALKFVLTGEVHYHTGCLICRRLNGIDEDIDECPCMFYEGRGLYPLEEAKKMITKWEAKNA